MTGKRFRRRARRGRATWAWLLALCASAIAAPARGQDTREAQRAEAQAEKATRLSPYVPSPTESRIKTIEDVMDNRRPVYPYIGSVFPGGFLGLGAGYRYRYNGTGRFDVHGAKSLKNYTLVETTLGLPEMADGRIKVDFKANWIDAPKVAFYGIGTTSRPEDQTTFLYRTTTVGGSIRVEPARFFAVGGRLDYLDVTTGPGKTGTSIERGFSSANTPGLGAHPRYARSGVFAEVDWRESPGYTTSGGLYRLDWSDYRATDDSPYSFRRVDAEVDQFVPLLRANWVIALRAMGSFTDTNADNAVPYFLLPDLGGGGMLRGYPAWRFRDRNLILLSAEYRWTAGQFVDMALFLDAGNVAPRLSDIAFGDLNTSYGIGATFHAPAATVIRLELARTRDAGMGLNIAFGPAF